MSEERPRPPAGPVVIAYDGSELAKIGIEEAGRLLSAGRDALVVCVWQPFDVGFVPIDDEPFDAAQAQAVRAAAEQTAAGGASLAAEVGFQSESLAIESAPTWKGIVKVAEERDASVIVLGSHGRKGFATVLAGSVAGAVAAHSRRTVLIAHGPAS
ncbi:MAG TPA: universal stress protein [Solirubrobacteraceae bacterium]|nr:universal stress protein [Solirubrobacteraceae bacterium]